MPLLNSKTLRKHPALIPLFVSVGFGALISFGYLARLAIASPEVSWNKRHNIEPWQRYDKKQYKFYNPGRDYNDVPERPKF